MTPETLEALKASIAKWERNAEATTPNDYHIGTTSCALCRLYHPRHGGHRDCAGCPVAIHTGFSGCSGTPYDKAMGAFLHWDTDEASAAKRGTALKLANAEVAFLKSLLPASPATGSTS